MEGRALVSWCSVRIFSSFICFHQSSSTQGKLSISITTISYGDSLILSIDFHNVCILFYLIVAVCVVFLYYEIIIKSETLPASWFKLVHYLATLVKGSNLHKDPLQDSQSFHLEIVRIESSERSDPQGQWLWSTNAAGSASMIVYLVSKIFSIYLQIFILL